MRIDNAMMIRNPSALLFVVIFFQLGTIAHAQQSNTVVTITGPQESNVVSRVERFDPDTNRTNVTIKTKYYRLGRLVEDKTERKGAIDLTALRIYHEGNLVMFQAWDSKSQLTQRTFHRERKAVVTEVSSKPDDTPDLILLHGSNEEIVVALRRNEAGELQMVDAATLKEIQRGSKAGTEFMNELSREAGAKSHSK